jgi:hypothetical protein
MNRLRNFAVWVILLAVTGVISWALASELLKKWPRLAIWY